MYWAALHTLGCRLNQLESEAIADSFRQAGFSLGAPESSPLPGIMVINTCTVTAKADQKSRRLIRKALREYPDSCVIVTGCYAHLDPAVIAALEAEDDARGRLFISNFSGAAGAAKSPLLDLPAAVQAAAALAPDRRLAEIVAAWFDSARRPVIPPAEAFRFQPKVFSFHARGYLKIQDGCDNGCAYCRVRLARGSSVSVPAESALEYVRSFEARGCPELMITGVNITQYRHGGFDLAGLLEYLLHGSDSIALRLASLEPEGITERLAAALAHPRIRPHFHLSVQSGSDAVLRAMGRTYTAQTVIDGARRLRAAQDDPFLACDIIAGFPGETAAAFEHTRALCARIGFAWIHAFPYSPRPGTAAFALKDSVSAQDKQDRTAVLTALALRGRRDYARSWIGRELSAVVEKSPAAAELRAVSANYLKLIVHGAQGALPGSVIRCIPSSLCDGADGESPDALADRIDPIPQTSFIG